MDHLLSTAPPTMFIAITGTRAAGKTSVEEYLVSQHKFQRVRLGKKPENGVPVSSSSTSSAVPEPIYIDTPNNLLTFVTQNWLSSYVTCDLDTPELVEAFHKRPFFLLVFVDAPLLVRFKRSHSNETLESFIEQEDALHYGLTPASSPLRCLSRLANIHLLNPFTSIPSLHTYLDSVSLTNPDRLRPQWDTYFMTLASLASHRSNCMKRRVGAILVRDKRIVATGYNGTPRNVLNCNEGGCKRCNSGGPSGESLDDCLCLHAEENALLEAGRERVGVGSVLYCNTCPCLGCAIKIVQTGVKEVVYNLSYEVDDRTEALFKEAGVIIRQHSPPSDQF